MLSKHSVWNAVRNVINFVIWIARLSFSLFPRVTVHLYMLNIDRFCNNDPLRKSVCIWQLTVCLYFPDNSILGRGDVSIHGEMHIFVRQRGWKWSICPRGYRDPADYGWNRDAQRSKRIERRDAFPFLTLSGHRPDPRISYPPASLLPRPFFLFLIRQVSRYACMIQNRYEIEIRAGVTRELKGTRKGR